MKLLSFLVCCGIILVSAGPVFAGKRVWNAGRTTVPDTLLSLELEDELNEEEPVDGEPAPELNEELEASAKAYEFFTESGIMGRITATKLKPAGALLPWLVYFTPEDPEESFAGEEEVAELKIEVLRAERWRFGNRFGALTHIKTKIEDLELGTISLVVGGKSEMIEVDILVDESSKEQVQEARHILETVVYDGKAPDRIQVTFPKL